MLLQSFVLLPAAIREQSHLEIIGDDPLLETFKQQYGAQEDITFTGFLQGKPLSDWYTAADVFVFPSDTETFGNVVLEAMASGTAVIGANKGGVGDIITHGKNGLLCEPGNVSQFVESMVQLCNDPILRGSFGTGRPGPQP